eukprot:g10634.t1
MANRERREILRGAEGRTFDLLAGVLTSEQWSELLRAPLEHAARQGNRGLALKLVKAGAEIGEALHAAVGSGYGDIMGDLLENGASVAAKDRCSGSTPLHVAAQGGQPEMVQLLLLKGADKDAMDNAGRTPIFVAAVHDHEATAVALMTAGADVNLGYRSYPMSVLHVASMRGNVSFMRAAIEHGANVDATDDTQSTPLHHAVILNRDEMIDVLVEAGANTEVRDDIGRTPLHCAAFNRPHDALLALLKHGAHVNARDDSQDTALHTAVSYAGMEGAAEVVDLLLRSDADETILNNMGETAADVVAGSVDDEDQLADDVERVRQLLANAPIDRVWRRRGYLVLCRAHPNRMQQAFASNSACEGVAGRTRHKAKLRRTQAIGCGGDVGASPVDGRTGGDWAEVVATVVGLQEEGIFRTIVGFL